MRILDLRTFTIVLLTYVGFMRFDEVSILTKGDVQFFSTHMSIFIERSKTDVYRDGNKIIISRLNSICCPVRTLCRYIQLGKVEKDEAFLFRAVTWLKRKQCYVIRATNKPISYSTCRVGALGLISRLGLNLKPYGLHSGRSGGATWAATRGCQTDCLRGMGAGRRRKQRTVMLMTI